MTKYVINSGNVRGNKEKAKKCVSETLNGLGGKPKILFCFFANPREDWESNFQNFVDDFVNYLPEGIEPQYEMAMPEKFEIQCNHNDVIWIKGGDDHLIQYWLKKFDLKKIWDKKVLSVSSASSDAVVDSFWTCDWRASFNGLGLVPIKFIPHFNSTYGANDSRGPIDWEKAKNELAEYGDKSLPIYALEEGDYVVFEV